MKTIRKTLIAVGLTLLCAACAPKCILDEERVFDHNVWNRFTPEQFDIEVSDAESYYHIEVTVAVDTALYRYTEVPLSIDLESPHGEKRRFLPSVALTESGRWRGEMRDGYRVVRGRVRSYFSFNSKGTHHLALGQQTSQYNLEGIHSVALHVEKAKLEIE